MRPGPSPRWLILLLVALAARAITFGNPILHVDEEFYFTAAHAMLHGAWPYVDVWDRKPVGLFLVYLPAAALGVPLGVWAYQAIALASATATAVLITRLADRAGWAKGALPAAILYILWLDLIEGQGGQAPVFYNLLMVAAVSLVAPRRQSDPHPPAYCERSGEIGPGALGSFSTMLEANGRARKLPRLSAAFAAMALAGFALQIKYSAVFEGMFLGLWLLWPHLRSPLKLFTLAIAFAATAIAPTVFAWAMFTFAGHGPAFLYANLWSILARRHDPLVEQLANLLSLSAILSPLIAMNILSWRTGLGQRAVRAFLFAWLAASILGVLAFGSWFDHYGLPVLAPAACCSAAFLGYHSGGRKAMPWILLTAFLGGQAMVLAKRAGRGTPAQFGRVVEAIGHGPGCLYVYSGSVMLYPFTGRCALTPYIFPSHLGRDRETGAIGVVQEAEVARIFAERPQVVVMRKPYRGERPEIRALALAELGRGYRLKNRLPLGHETIWVYTRH